MIKPTRKRPRQLSLRSMQMILNRIIGKILDFFDDLKDPDRLMPPRSLMQVFPENFKQVGQEFKKIFIEHGGLLPDHKVLDVGCSVGRMALPLTDYLSKDGEYWGFDVNNESILWCQNHITPRFENFHFIHSDVVNNKYNKIGSVNSQDYKFPFTDNYFDLIFLVSVFTHMLPPGVENYLSEISRVLKPGGICMITLFLLNDKPERMGYPRMGYLDFKIDHGDYFSINSVTPEDSVAYKEDYFLTLTHKFELKTEKVIRHNSRSIRKDYETSQDLLFLTKVSSS